MLEENFEKFCDKIRYLVYLRVIRKSKEQKRGNLSAMEIILMEIISAMDNPTINEFSKAAELSPPNAAYRINRLISKGYVEKVQNPKDKREFYLKPTEKYERDYQSKYLHFVSRRMNKRFSEEDKEELDKMLQIINEELMPEIGN